MIAIIDNWNHRSKEYIRIRLKIVVNTDEIKYYLIDDIDNICIEFSIIALDNLLNTIL